MNKMHAEATQPAAAQEAAKDRLLVALERAVWAETSLRELADECENHTTPGWEDRMQSCLLHARQVLKAAPVAAAPTDEDYSVVRASTTAAPVDLHAHLLHMLGAKDHEDAGRIIGELHAASMSTPAAPGIDSEQFRELKDKCQRIQENRDFWHGVAEKLREELFEAREKFAKTMDSTPAAPGIDLATAIRNCCEAEMADPDHPDTICINVNELTAILQQCVTDASPKGGSDEASIPEPHQECYSDNDGDSWYDHPADSMLVDGLAVGDTYTLSVSHYSVGRTYRVTKAPDETSDDYEVEPMQATSAEVGS